MNTTPFLSSEKLCFLKLGGSLITDKQKARTPRLALMANLAAQIAQARQANPGLNLVIGHGAGSFAHVPARRYQTRQGVQTPEQWMGFAEVWWEAAALNRLVMDALHQAALPAIALSPCASILACDGKVLTWNLSPLQRALHAGLLPVIYGDVIFDTQRGGTILSTEDLFEHLARSLHPTRILLAGIEAGVWEDYPHCTRLVEKITPASFGDIASHLGGSNAVDVTGGMATKVQQSLALVQEIPGLEIFIFSGEAENALFQALHAPLSGTWIVNP